MEPASAPPLHVVVMGVSGTGKSTVAERLAAHHDLDFIEGDGYHPADNIAKMSAGIPLTEEDRVPWLEALAALTELRDTQGISTVLTCSALRRSYRDILRSGAPAGRTFFVHLHGAFDVLDSRMRSRSHFMPPSLLQSQFDTLEPLGSDEEGTVVDVAQPLEAVVAEAARVVEAARRAT